MNISYKRPIQINGNTICSAMCPTSQPTDFKLGKTHFRSLSLPDCIKNTIRQRAEADFSA